LLPPGEGGYHLAGVRGSGLHGFIVAWYPQFYEYLPVLTGTDFHENKVKYTIDVWGAD